MGEYNVLDGNEAHPHVDRRITRLVTHSSFDRASYEYDIALLKMVAPVSFQVKCDINIRYRQFKIASIFANYFYKADLFFLAKYYSYLLASIWFGSCWKDWKCNRMGKKIGIWTNLSSSERGSFAYHIKQQMYANVQTVGTKRGIA